MAISKSEVNDVGQSTKYHRIIAQETDFSNSQIHVIVASYVNSDYREMEKAEEQKISDEIAALNSNFKTIEHSIHTIDAERNKIELEIEELRNHLIKMSGRNPADKIMAEYEEKFGQLHKGDSIPPFDYSKISEVEHEYAEAMQNMSDKIEVLTASLNELMQKRYELEARLSENISKMQSAESKTIVPRWIQVEKYTIPLDEADMRGAIYQKLMELAPFSGGTKA